MNRKDLRARAEILYNKSILDGWLEAHWQRFEERIFDVSGRLGGDWGQSLSFEDLKEAMDCLMYIELNVVRAGLVERPEEYEGCSLYYREIRKDKWMMAFLQRA